eukprot:6213424-Pleurochrysis_carterae.AAC.3
MENRSRYMHELISDGAGKLGVENSKRFLRGSGRVRAGCRLGASDGVRQGVHSHGVRARACVRACGRPQACNSGTRGTDRNSEGQRASDANASASITPSPLPEARRLSVRDAITWQQVRASRLGVGGKVLLEELAHRGRELALHQRRRRLHRLRRVLKFVEGLELHPADKPKDDRQHAHISQRLITGRSESHCERGVCGKKLRQPLVSSGDKRGVFTVLKPSKDTRPRMQRQA